MARIAAKVAARDDGDTIDNKALGQPFKYTGKKDTDFAEWDHFSWELDLDRKSLRPRVWLRDRRNQLSKLFLWIYQIHCFQ